MSSFKYYSVKNYLQAPILDNEQEQQLHEGSFLQNFRENLKIDIISYDEDEMVFDLIGVDASIANALRRIFLAEVCYILNLSNLQVHHNFISPR